MRNPVSDIAAAINGTSLCWRCIAAKAGVNGQQLDDALAVLREDIRVVTTLAPCEGCQRDTLLYRIG